MIHKYYMNGYYIVLDVHSGCVHVVDKIVYDMLDDFQGMSYDEIVSKYTQSVSEPYKNEEVEEAWKEINFLKRQKILFSEDIYADVIPAVNKRNPVVKALCLLVAHDCNLQCEYCFAEEGEYHTRGKRGMMSLETGKKAIDFLIENSGNRKNLEVDFFGGEPLMNFQVVKDIVSYARSIEKDHGKNFRFTITTNGVLLNDEKLAYINEHMYNMVLSLDGRKEVNDRVRKTRNGQSVYDLVMPNFVKAAESRGQDNYYIRGTFTGYNLDFGKDVLHLADMGFKQISVEPVVGDKTLPYTLQSEHLETIFNEYEQLAKTMLSRVKTEKDFNFFHFMIDLTGGPCVAKRMVGCGAGTEYLAVTADGDLYPCHQFVGFEDFKMGSLAEGVLANELRATFEVCNVYAKEECKNCWSKFYCSGGCAANAYTSNGTIMKPYEIGCELQRKRAECAIMMKVASQDENEDGNE